jgi:hypothetical protein
MGYEWMYSLVIISTGKSAKFCWWSFQQTMFHYRRVLEFVQKNDV